MGSDVFNKMLDIIIENSQTSDANGTILFGTVESLEPISVRINENILLSSDFLIVSKYLKKYKVTMPHDHVTKISTETDKGTLTGTGLDGTPTSHTHTVIPHIHQIQTDTGDVSTQKALYVELEMYPKLMVHDEVILLPFANRQKFYIIERIEKE